MPIKKLDFKFVNELRRNQHIKELADAVNSNADALLDFESGILNGYSGANASTKKIYCHPILLYSTSTKNRIMFLLFNNDPTPFTMATLFDLIVSNDNIRLMCNGIFDSKQILYIVKTNATTIQLVYVDLEQASGVSNTGLTYEDFVTVFANGIIDTVHAIN